MANQRIHVNTLTDGAASLPTIILLNATSLAKNCAIQQYHSDLLSFSADIGLVTETWLTNNHSSAQFSIENFTTFRRDRVGRRGGGVAAFVNGKLPSYIVSTPSSSSVCEVLWINVIHNLTSLFIGCVYHPPRPKYIASTLMSVLAEDIDHICSLSDNAIVILAGDFNTLDTSFITTDLGLIYLSTNPTHGPNTLDKVFISQPDLFVANIANAILKTKHKLVYLKDASATSTCDDLELINGNNRIIKKSVNYNLSVDNVNKLRFNLSALDSVCLSSSPVCYFNACFEFVKSAINCCIPCKQTTIRAKDPAFLTPMLKSLLRQRYKLRKKSKTDQADIINKRINAIISFNNSRALSGLANASSKELWKAMRKNSNNNTSNICRFSSVTLNTYFTSVSTDKDSPYDFLLPVDVISSTLSGVGFDDNVFIQDLEFMLQPYKIEKMLAKVKSKSNSVDGIPPWLWKTCSYETALAISNIFMHSLISGYIPDSWKKAVVTPIPKVTTPRLISDFRPISVTSVLSRILEKLVVRSYLHPILNAGNFSDQFAYRPMGSTTSALTFLTHNICHMLETCKYVRCLTIDFSKAFDTVDRSILLAKLLKTELNPNIIRWISAFLSNRQQAVYSSGVLSSYMEFNLGIIQGSSLGPSLFAIMLSDLKPLSPQNGLVKFADDSTLMAPESSDIDLQEEFLNVISWSKTNKLSINFGKTKELVFRRASISPPILPPPLDNIERVLCSKLLGVKLQDNLRFSMHVDCILSTVAQRMFLLKSLKFKGMDPVSMNRVFNAIILGSINYALPVWGGFVSQTEEARINSILKKCFKFGYCILKHDFNSLLRKADYTLFRSMQISSHPLHCLLPPTISTFGTNRPKGHNFLLPQIRYENFKKSFLVRALFAYV